MIRHYSSSVVELSNLARTLFSRVRVSRKDCVSDEVVDDCIIYCFSSSNGSYLGVDAHTLFSWVRVSRKDCVSDEVVADCIIYCFHLPTVPFSASTLTHCLVGFALAVRSPLQEYLQQVNLLRHIPSSVTCLSAKARTLTIC